MTPPDSPSEPLHKDEFAQKMMQAIRDAGEEAALRYDPEHYRLCREGDVTNEMNLANAYAEYCAAAEEKREALFRRFVRVWFSYRRETPAEFEDAQSDLLPTVRSRLYFVLGTLTLEEEKGAEVDWPCAVLADSLGVSLVYDLPDSMVQIQQHNLDEWKVTFEQAFEVACDNLRQITRAPLEQVAPGVWRSPWRDNYDPSRMLLLDLIRGHEVAGDPVILVPNRDTLLLSGAEDADGLGKLATLAEEAYDDRRSISAMAFRLAADDQWHPFLPPEDHPHYQAFKLLQLRTMADDYGEQAQALNALHEKSGSDIFVAGFSALKNEETAEVRSYCVWYEGAVALLPRTEDILFFRPRSEEDGDIVAVARWEQAQAVLGEMMKPVGLYPERYLVEDFPSEDQLTALGAQNQ